MPLGPSNGAPNKNTHFLAADLLRGIAIISVVVYHAFTILFGTFVPWNGWTRNFAEAPSRTLLFCYPVSFGWAGVSLFFVLSGFCIHLSFLRSRAFSTGHFFWNRFWRIVPAYFVALVAFSVLGRLALDNRSGVEQFVSHLLFLHDFFNDTFQGINPSFWSIATEVQLYIMFPALLWIRRRNGIEGCLVFTLGLGLAWRLFAAMRWGLPDWMASPGFSSPLVTWFDWTLGAYVAERLGQSRVAFTRRPLWLALSLAALVISSFYKPLTVFGFSLAAIASAIVLDWSVWADIRQTVVTRSLGFVGTVSYSLYLWHQPLLNRLLYRLPRYMNGPATFVSIAVFLGLLAFLSYRLIERGGIVMGKVLWQHARQGPGKTRPQTESLSVVATEQPGPVRR